MATNVPPWLRAVFAAPNALYRHGMGRVLGRRFLQLTHVGRKSGAEHTVVLEVLRYNRDTGDEDRRRVVEQLPLIAFRPA